MEIFEQIINLVGVLAWPVVVVILVFAFRRKIAGLIERTREFEGPGDFKLKLDPRQVERIVEESNKGNIPADEVAERIIRQAVVDARELRILRALVGEDEGRILYSYQSAFYRPALDSLSGKGFIRKENKKYLLTDSGMEMVRAHLVPMLTEQKDD